MDQKTAKKLVGKVLEIVHEMDVWDRKTLSYVKDPNFAEEVLVSNAEDTYFGYSTFGSDEGTSIYYHLVKKWRLLKGGRWRK